jgi:hypothetical protein
MKTHHKFYALCRSIVCAALWMLAVNAGATETVFTNEFWISTNTATLGLGTLSNPIDCSTAAKFDSNMNYFPANSTIHVLAGRYETGGSAGWLAKSSQNIVGSGIDITTLHLTNASPFVWTMVSVSPATNVAVSDITFDLIGSTNGGAVALLGGKHSIRRVKVANATSTASAIPYLLVIDSATNGISDGNIIEECLITNFKGGPCRAISLNGTAGNPVYAIIRNNQIYLQDLEVSGSIDQDAIAGSFMANTLIEGNYIAGAASGIYMH